MTGTGSEPRTSGATACELLRVLAARTWGDIRDGEAVSIKIGEESITDHLLLDLARYFPHPTFVRKWNRLQEGRETGADWDWWFVDMARRVAVGLRIQAKRIDYANERVTGLERQNRHGLQQAMLQRSADRAGLHPLYCLYLASLGGQSGPTACGSLSSDEAPPGWVGSPLELYGCALVGPEVVKGTIATGRFELGFFWPFLLPWSCLVCCEGLRGSLVERVDQQAMRVESRAPVDAVAVRSPRPLVRDISDLPPEVGLVAAGEGPTEDIWDDDPHLDVGATAVTLIQPDPGEG